MDKVESRLIVLLVLIGSISFIPFGYSALDVDVQDDTRIGGDLNVTGNIWLTGNINVTGTGNALVNTITCPAGQHIFSVNNSTGIVTCTDNSAAGHTNMTTTTCPAGQHIFSVNNATGIVTCTADSGGGGGSATVGNRLATWTVFANSSGNFAINGTDGTIDFNNADYGTLINTLEDTLPNGGCIFTRAGNYTVTAGNRIIFNDPNICFKGEGSGITTLFAGTGLDDRVIHVSVGADNLRLSDFDIQGNSNGQTSNNANCMNIAGNVGPIWQVFDVTIQNVDFYDCFASGILIENTTRLKILDSTVRQINSDSLVSTCIRATNSIGSLFRGNNLIDCGVDSAHIPGVDTGNGIWVHGGNGSRIVNNFANNTARDSFTFQETYGGVMSGNTVDLTFDSCYTIADSSRVTVTGNSARRCGGTGFFASDVTGVSYTANTVLGCGTTLLDGDRGAFVLTGGDGGSNNTLFIGNTVEDVDGENGCDFAIRVRPFANSNMTVALNDFSGVIINATHGWLDDQTSTPEADRNYRFFENRPYDGFVQNTIRTPTEFFSSIFMMNGVADLYFDGGSDVSPDDRFRFANGVLNIQFGNNTEYRFNVAGFGMLTNNIISLDTISTGTSEENIRSDGDSIILEVADNDEYDFTSDFLDLFNNDIILENNTNGDGGGKVILENFGGTNSSIYAFDDNVIRIETNNIDRISFQANQISLIGSTDLNMADNEILNVRLQNSATPPDTCGASVRGQIWFDTDTGITYVCHITDRWLSNYDMEFRSANNGVCPFKTDIGNFNCAFSWGQVGSPSGSRTLYIPFNFTVLQMGQSMTGADCVTDGYTIEIWTSSGNTDASATETKTIIKTNSTDQTSINQTVNVDIEGDRFWTGGLNNGCGENIIGMAVNFIYRWHHD